MTPNAIDLVTYLSEFVEPFWVSHRLPISGSVWQVHSSEAWW